MGYDMYVRAPSADDLEVKEAAHAKLVEAAARRDNGTGTQDEVMAAWAEMDAADPTYFRWNVWGMMTGREILFRIGAMYDSTMGVGFPDAGDYGLDMEQVYEADGEIYPDPAKQANYEQYRLAVEIALTVPSPEQDRLPSHKFGSNDGWIVTPAECRAAVEIIDATSEERLRTAIVDAGEEGDDIAYWVDEIKRFRNFLDYAAEHDGMEVC